MDTVQQVESQLIMRHYDGFMKKGSPHVSGARSVEAVAADVRAAVDRGRQGVA
jgi:hypothetical protein